jgi:hypothetical protein
MLCGATNEDESDELCRSLDHAMVQSLLKLQVVPVALATLARTELVPAVCALRKHECERICALAGDIFRGCGWRTAAEGDLVKVRACPHLRPPAKREERGRAGREAGEGEREGEGGGRRRGAPSPVWRGSQWPTGVEGRRCGRRVGGIDEVGKRSSSSGERRGERGRESDRWVPLVGSGEEGKI